MDSCENYPVRKKNRLIGFDYSSPNAYFITICTRERQKLFWTDVGATNGRPLRCQLLLLK